MIEKEDKSKSEENEASQHVAPKDWSGVRIVLNPVVWYSDHVKDEDSFCLMSLFMSTMSFSHQMLPVSLCTVKMLRKHFLWLLHNKLKVHIRPFPLSPFLFLCHITFICVKII